MCLKKKVYISRECRKILSTFSILNAIYSQPLMISNMIDEESYRKYTIKDDKKYKICESLFMSPRFTSFLATT
jgi:hypothetical protein